MKRKWSSGIAVLLVLLVCAEVCPPSPQGTLAGRRECPHTYSDSARVFAEEVAGIDVPEFNDCQRFLVEDGETGELSYGGYFAIFAVSIANELEDSLAKYEENLPLGFGRVAFSAAIVLAEGDYEPLGIRNGLNCLLVWRDPRGSENWVAKMTPRDSTRNEDCSGLIDPDSVGGQQLQVMRRESVGLTEADKYTWAARWGWDQEHKVQIAGITCSRAWCNVGEEGRFARPETYHERKNPSNVSAEWKRVTDIKGWYDEQLLAAMPQATGADPRPSRILGTIIPDTSLATKTMQHFQSWQAAAQVDLSLVPEGKPEEIEGYTAKFGFTETSGDRLNKISACHGEYCVPENATIRGNCTCPITEPNCNDRAWFAKVEGADGSEPVYHRMCRYTMCGVTIPATARWRWLAGDEGTWFRCVDGCCELTGEE